MKLPTWQAGNEDDFWRVVESCLIEIFGFADNDARRRVADLRVDLERAKLSEPQITYHDEPLNIAADLSGRPYKLDREVIGKYERILQRVA